ncbi:hypothetical protein [Paenibacillus phytorum]|uniref:hypothetical protein n=1 Tax=Paenibacillus phytorum TaxID=2654977 RepID=UPI001FEBC7A6
MLRDRLLETKFIHMVLLVNKKLIGDIKIEGFEDLLNPNLKGKIAFPDPWYLRLLYKSLKAPKIWKMPKSMHSS